MTTKKHIQLGYSIPSEIESINRLVRGGFNKIANALLNRDWLRGDENTPIAIYEVKLFAKGDEVSTEVVEIYASRTRESSLLGGCLNPHPLRSLAKQIAKEAYNASGEWKPYASVAVRHIGGSLPVELTQGSGRLLFGHSWVPAEK